MHEDRQLLAAKISAEIRALTNLNQVCEWLIQRQHNPVRVNVEHLPAFARQGWLNVGRPVTARRAVLCTLWLLEEIDARVCLLAGTLRFVAHPTASEVTLSFEGRAVPTAQIDIAARQLLELVASSIGRPRVLGAAG